MSLTAKVFFTWLMFFLPIIIYGFWEISVGDGDYRWLILGLWLSGLFIIGLYTIWK